MELINLRVMCIGQTAKPKFQLEAYAGPDASKARKKSRPVYLPLQQAFKTLDVYDGAELRFGNKVVGPAVIEQANTTAFVAPEFSLLVDKFGSYTMYMKIHEEAAEKRILN